MPKLDVTVTLSNGASTAVDAWRVTQTDGEGNPLYPTNKALAESILKDAIKRILSISPTVPMRAELAKKRNADKAIEALKDSAVT